jgi:hypothetical protein
MILYVVLSGQEINMNLYDRVQQDWVSIPIKDKFPVDENGAPCYAKPTGRRITYGSLDTGITNKQPGILWWGCTFQGTAIAVRSGRAVCIIAC